MNLLWPGLLLGGSLLVAGPIIIHLLNRRRFRPLDWAAMDFLMEANRRNRRRIRLEDLLLLLLRCAAVALIALLVARPYRTHTHGGGWLDAAGYQRIVILDDSLSTACRVGGRTQFAAAKEAIGDWVRRLSSGHGSDSFALLLTSRPRSAVVDVAALSSDNLAEVSDRIGQLEPSSLAARLSQALDAVRESFDRRSAAPNRIVYLFTDLRRRDWAHAAEGENAATSQDGEASHVADGRSSGIAALRELADTTAGCYVVDTGSDDVDNLVLAGVVPKQPVLAAGVPAELDVVVRNQGRNSVAAARVELAAEGQLPLTESVPTIAARGSATVQFRFAPPPAPVEEDDAPLAPIPIRFRLTVDDEQDDRIETDNTYHFAARIVRGIKTLIVDGDPSPVARDSESFYLQRALTPPGDLPAGVVVDVVGPSELETVNLDRYQVVYLCNLEDISQPRRESLERWVRGGGGLVIAPGDQLYDPHDFNTQLFRQGQGVSPVALEALGGSEDPARWVHLQVVEPNHDVLRLYEGENNPLLELVRVFRWWKVVAPDDESSRVRVLARYTDPDQSPAIVEQQVGEGRVMLFASPLDDDWSNWPEEPAGSVFVALLQDLTRYLARASGGDGQRSVGEPLRHEIDLARFQQAVRLRLPRGESIGLQPVPVDGAVEATGGRDESRWRVQHDDTRQPGFYQLDLQRIDTLPQAVLFAANTDPSESDLTRADGTALASALEGSNVRWIDGSQLGDLTTADVRSEWWKYVVVVLAGVLCGELLLGWFLGRERT